LEIIIGLTLNSAAEWTGSMFQVVVEIWGVARAFIGFVLSRLSFATPY